MKRICLALACLLLARTAAASGWFEANARLAPVFPPDVWAFIQKADRADARGNIKTADYYLRLAKARTDGARPFTADNWPKGWPRLGNAAELLTDATPEAYIEKIIGDYAAAHARPKEAIAAYTSFTHQCLVPNTDGLATLARLLQGDGLYEESLLTYRDLARVIESRNFFGAAYSSEWTAQHIKHLEMLLKPVPAVVLNLSFNNIPEFLQKDFTKIYRDGLSTLKNVVLIPDRDLARVLREESLDESDLEDDTQLATVGRMLNAHSMIKGTLLHADKNYIFQVRIFEPAKRAWTEKYDYSNQDYRNLPNFVARFTQEFSGTPVSVGLYLPSPRLTDSYESDSEISDLKMSANGDRVICGSESGSVYVFGGRGGLQKKFRAADRVLQVGISPEGRYYAWADLKGTVTFASTRGIIWKHSFPNLIRGVAVAEEGKFVAAAVNNRVWFLDRRAEVFWNAEAPTWISSLSVSADARHVLVGTEDGDVLAFTEEGNLAWKEKMKAAIVRTGFSPEGAFAAAEDSGGELSVFNPEGKSVFSLKAGEEKQFSAFSADLLSAVAGQRGRMLYFFSRDGQTLWDYQIDDKVSHLGAARGRYVAAESKNLFFMTIDWK